MEEKSAIEEVEKSRDAGFDVEWLDLPRELWTVIAKHANANDDDNDTTFEIHRFRSVCKTWRSAHPSPPRPSAPPRQVVDDELIGTKIKVYRLEPLSSHHQERPSNSPSKGWIIVLKQLGSRPFRLCNPFTGSRVVSYSTLPMVLNSINFRAVELMESLYVYNFGGLRFSKTVLFEGCIVCALFKGGRLIVYKTRDENWTDIADMYVGSKDYHDIILHKGRVFAMDNQGTLFWMNPSSLMLEPCPQSLNLSLCSGKEKKHMVACGASLYVVGMQIKGHEEVDIQVYKLIEEDDDGRWVNVKNLGDILFVLGKYTNFSLSARDYYGCQGNCVYFSHGHGDKVLCFSLEDSKLITSPNPFWPCPTLFSPEFNFPKRFDVFASILIE